MKVPFYISFITSTLLILSGCSNDNVSEQNEEQAEVVNKNCFCGSSYTSSQNDTADFVFSLKPDYLLSVCGNLNQTISDDHIEMIGASVFECDGTQEIISFSEIHKLELIQSGDSLIINRILSFPDETATWQAVPFSQTILKIGENGIEESKEKVLWTPPILSDSIIKKVITTRIDTISNVQQTLFLEQLTMLAASGNKEAKQILFSLEELSDVYQVGQHALHLQECKMIVDWIIHDKYDYMMWH